MPLTEVKDFAAYLRTATTDLGIDSSQIYELKELTGGTANYVFRVTHQDGHTTILKHAEPFVRNTPSLVFPVERMNFEARSLRVLPDILQLDEVTRPARFIGYDEAACVLHMSDGGNNHLKDAYSDPSLDIPEAGLRLGKWLARLHGSTAKTDIGHNGVAKAISRYSYNNLSGALKGYGFDPMLGDEINEQFGSLSQSDDVCICHGDFWPGNVLVKTSPLRLTIVDWEMTRRGNGATDVGQFSAEAWLLDRFRGGKGLLRAFLNGYVAEMEQGCSREDAQRAAIHFGTHLAYWPTRVVWGNHDETVECVRLGVEYLTKAKAKDWKWLGHSDLDVLFPDLL
jgi:Ser/Thr protein kinase RdoA (MazF antagonist)